MSLLLNIVWLVFGGVWMALGWLVATVVMAVTIVGIPWARSALTMARYTLLPFGHTVVDRSRFDAGGVGTSKLGLLGNLIWLALAGWWLALGHLMTAAALAVTVVGLPFAWAHWKLAILALWPVGKDVVSKNDLGATNSTTSWGTSLC